MPNQSGFINTLLRWILPSVMMAMILVSVTGVLINSEHSDEAVYYCPPCGCGADHDEPTVSGSCQYCSMPLIRTKDGRLGEIADVVGNIFMGNRVFGAIYSRFVYPTIFVGIIIGMLSILFFRKKSIELFLALFILCWSIYALKFQTYGTGHGLTRNMNMAFFPGSFILFLGPLLSFHSAKLLNSNFQFSRKYWVHMIPGIFVFVSYVILFLLPLEMKQGHLFTDFDPYLGIIEQFGGIISLTAYMTYRFREASALSNEERAKRKTEISWLNRFYVGTYALLFIWLTNLMLNAVFFELKSATLTYVSFWIGLCLYLYWVVFEVFRNEKILIQKYFSFKVGDDVDMSEFKEKFRGIMDDEKPYTDPGLTLAKLAECMNTKPKQLSKKINSAFHKNFYALINEYRIAEVKRLLSDPDFDHLTIVAVSEQAGFNSKSSFNSIFKKEVGITPKEFKSQRESQGR